MKRWNVLVMIAMFGFGTVHAYGSEASEFNKLAKNRTELVAQINSTLDEWERDPDWVKARELEKIGVDRIMGKRNQFELDLGYDYLTDNFGHWENFRMKYLRREMTYVYFVELESFFRREGNGVQLVGGIYKDWKSWLYTYTAVAAGTNSEYLPQFRFDHDFNFKFGKKRNYVFTVGGTYVDYHVNHRDVVLSAGLTGYFDKWILGYRVFRNISYPDSVGSYSNLFEVTYGREGNHWTSLLFSFGNQAYASTELISPEKVDQTLVELRLKHQHWIGKNWGLFGEGRFFRLSDEYKKYGLTLGVFLDF